MDIDTDKSNTSYYKYGENRIKKLNFDLWKRISNLSLDIKFKEKFYLFYWCKNGIRYHRFRFRKDKLIKEGFDCNKTEIEIMHSRDYYRLFDCGSKKWIYSIN